MSWTFIPTRAPWYWGFWERLTGLTKNAIKKVLGRSFVTYDELVTVITEIETVLNDHPLTFISSNADDDISLTPNHLLHGRPLTSLPYITVSDEEIEDPTYGNHCDVNKRYEHLSNLQNQFWKRWSTEYLTALRERHSASGNKDNVIKVGDIVIIHSDIARRLKWQLGTVKRFVSIFTVVINLCDQRKSASPGAN